MTTFLDSGAAPAKADGPDWWIYRGTGAPLDGDLADLLPPPPPWRDFRGDPVLPTPQADEVEYARRLGRSTAYPPEQMQVQMVNAAIYLRRPLLVTGRPGTGKSSLAYKIARELRLGPVLHWPITTSSTLATGLYDYDAIGRVQAASIREAGKPAMDTGIGNYVQLGPLGTALLPYAKPRVLLIDEIDKSDINLPNDLLSVLEEGSFRIRELARLTSVQPEITVFTADPDVAVPVRRGRVVCRAFPIIVITSNGERELPPAFIRRCLRLDMAPPDMNQLAGMVASHFPAGDRAVAGRLIQSFVEHSVDMGGLPADQLLNAVYLATSGAYAHDISWVELVEAIWRQLSESAD